MPPMLRVLQRIFALSDSDEILILVQEYLRCVFQTMRFLVVIIVDMLREVGVHSFGGVVEEVAAGFVQLYGFFGAFAEFDVEALQQAVVLGVLEVVVDPA